MRSLSYDLVGRISPLIKFIMGEVLDESKRGTILRNKNGTPLDQSLESYISPDCS
jgi:hypothetical protein